MPSRLQHIPVAPRAQVTAARGRAMCPRLTEGLLALVIGTTVWAQGWQPQKHFEILVGSAPGGSNDRTDRVTPR